MGDLLQSEIAEKQAPSIRYQITIAKASAGQGYRRVRLCHTPINEGLVLALATGDFVADQRNLVLVSGTGTGKTDLAIGIVRAFIRSGNQGRMADYLTRLHSVISSV